MVSPVGEFQKRQNCLGFTGKSRDTDQKAGFHPLPYQWGLPVPVQDVMPPGTQK